MDFLITGLIEVFSDMAKGIMGFFVKDFWKGMCIAKVNYSTGKLYQYNGHSSHVELMFNEYLPGAAGDDIQTIFKIMGFTIVLFLFFLNLAKAFLPQEASQSIQHPFETVGRTAAATFAVFNAYLIMALVQTPMATIFNKIYNISNNAEYMQKNFYGGDYNSFKLVDNAPTVVIPDVNGVEAIVISAICLFILIAITWSFIQLIAEVIERYVVMCFLFYVSPVAFSCIGSNSTQNVASSFIRMIFTQYLLMMFNICFVYVFCYAFTNQPDDLSGARSAIIYYMVLLAWLKLGRSLDEHMRSLGLSTAQTGRGMVSEVMFAGMMAMRGMQSVASGIKSTARGAKTVASGAKTVASGVKSSMSFDTAAQEARNVAAGNHVMNESLAQTPGLIRAIENGGISGTDQEAIKAASTMTGIDADKISSVDIPKNFSKEGITITGQKGEEVKVFPVENTSSAALSAAGISDNDLHRTFNSGENGEYSWVAIPTNQKAETKSGIFADIAGHSELQQALGASQESAQSVCCFDMTADSSFAQKHAAIPEGNYTAWKTAFYETPNSGIEVLHENINGEDISFVNRDNTNYVPLLKDRYLHSGIDKVANYVNNHEHSK